MSKNVNITIDADGSKAEKEIDKVSKSLDGLDKSASKASDSASKASDSVGKVGSVSTKTVAIGAALGNVIGNVLSKAFSALASEIDGAVKRLDTLNNFPKVMANMKVSSADAEKSVAILSDKLRGLPTSLDDAILSVQRFTATNGNIKASTAAFLALNNAILAGGASAQLQSSALEQMSQAYTKGRADSMEWRTLLQAMPAQMNQIAQAMGYTNAALGGDFYNAMQNGTVSMNDFMGTIVKLNKQGVNGFGSFAEQAAASTNGVGTSITNLKLTIQRGLAEIMNAIGQSNIAGFFNGIASAIGTVTNYIVAFVKIAVQAVNALRSLFGMGKAAGSSTSKSVADASASAGSLATSAGNAGSALGGANKAAKQLKKTLSSFDEMNVLQEPQAASGAGGGGAGGGGNMGDIGAIGFGNLWDGFDEGESKVDEIMARFQKAINKLNFNKWHRAIQEFKKGMTNAFTIAGNAASSFYNKELVPLAKFFVESLIPDAIRDIGKAFQRLDVSSWSKGFDSLFSGRETYLEGLYGTLEKIGGAIANVFTTMANIVVPPALSAIGAIFEMIGQVLQGIGEGFQFVWIELIEPSLTRFAEFMQPVIDHLQSFFEHLQQCQPLMEALKIIGQTLGTVLGAAFMVIVGAIQAVIGAITLLVDGLTHLLEFAGWVIGNIGDFFYTLGQNVATIFQNIWNGIVTVFTPIVNFFKGLFEGVGNVISGAWNAMLNGAKGAWNGIKNVFSTVANFFGTIFTNAWNAVKAVFSTGGKIFMGIVDGIISGFKAIVNAIITGINAVVAVPFNAINGVLSGMKSIDILGIKPFGWVNTISVPQIPKLAKGGVIDGATLAMVGENGREAVMPLENNTAWIAELAQQINQQGGGAPTQIIVKLGEDTIIDKVIEGINEKSNLSGRNAIAV